MQCVQHPLSQQAKMKGHVKIWWQEVQLERNRTRKEKIKRWDHMCDKLKK